MIPFTIQLDNGQEQVLNLDEIQRITFVPETDTQPRLADDPAPTGILAVILFSADFSVTIKGDDADRLLSAVRSMQDRLIYENGELNSILYPPAEGGE